MYVVVLGNTVNERATSKLEGRITDIANGSRDDVDMNINKDKTKVLHVRAQDKVWPTTSASFR